MPHCKNVGIVFASWRVCSLYVGRLLQQLSPTSSMQAFCCIVSASKRAVFNSSRWSAYSLQMEGPGQNGRTQRAVTQTHLRHLGGGLGRDAFFL